MQALIKPGGIYGDLAVPASKSMTQRAYASALLHHGKTIIRNAGNSDDERAALRIIQQLGATITQQSENTIEVISHFPDGVGFAKDTIIDCGESGLAARLFTPIAALSAHTIKISGTGSLLHRPLHISEEVLASLNVTMQGFTGHLPVTVQGPMQAVSVKMSGLESSQFLSGLLFALSYCAKESVEIEMLGLKSKPYIDMTLEVMRRFGKPIAHDNYKVFYVSPSLFSNIELAEIDIEGDWSGAANLIVAAAIAGKVIIRNLNGQSTQADRAIVDVLNKVGAMVTEQDHCVTVKMHRLRAFDFDATHCPDLFPILAILAACSEGESDIKGVHRLFYKESNRVESIAQMLENFEVPFAVRDDILHITGVEYLQSATIDSYNDHRIAMAAAVGALRADGRVTILHATAVNKSYPDFFRDLILSGVNCKLQHD